MIQTLLIISILLSIANTILLLLLTRAPRSETLLETLKQDTRATLKKTKDTVVPQRAQIISPIDRHRHDLNDLNDLNDL